MALNPFFLQGSTGEQRIIQELINEQLKIYGVEVTYIPRKFVRKQTIIEEVQSSKFDDNFLLEAYVNTYDGYSGAGDIMTKFGVSLRDEITLTISRERFEDFIAPFLDEMSTDEIIVDDRPREGDLVFFPLGNRLFEVKFVEHEVPFYQLGKNYVYELKCELFEYEDEVIDTSIDAIDRTVEDQGYLIDLTLFSGGTIATATASVGTGYVSSIFLNDDGYGFTSSPTITFSAPVSTGTTAQAVAITTTRNNITSIKEILMTNAGAGYTEVPTITISGGGGAGAAATCGIITAHRGVVSITVNEAGVGYGTAPVVNIGLPPLSPQIAASAEAVVSAGGSITAIYIRNAGAGFLAGAPNVTVGAAATTGIGTYWFNELVVGDRSNSAAYVKRWDTDTNQLRVGIQSGTFYEGELVTGQKSGAAYVVSNAGVASTETDKYRQNEDIEFEADNIIDFSETNPFGTV